MSEKAIAVKAQKLKKLLTNLRQLLLPLLLILVD